MNRRLLARRPRKVLAAGLCTALTGASLAVLTAAPAGAVGFSNSAPITIPSLGEADPYPSAITVAGLGDVADVNVQLVGIAHTHPDDIGVLLVGPTGVKVLLMTDVGSEHDISGVSVLIDDDASASMPNNAQLFSGTYRPSSFGLFDVLGVPPATPAGPYETALNAFNGTSPNGVWSLYVLDDTHVHSGSISAGWSLEITPAPPRIISFTPTSGLPGTSVTISGTGFQGATSVTFGGEPATFTVNSGTQITATVPAAAETGPIAVVTPAGTGASATSFTVVSLEHGRRVSLVVGRKARGTVTVDDAFAVCASEVPVRVQHRQDGRWQNVGTDITSTDGAFVVPGTREPGRYRAIASRVTLASDDVCLKATSPVVNH